MMLFSAYNYFTNPATADGFQTLGFPVYFPIELGIAKVLGAILLLVPQIPYKVKEWAYAGFGITFISAAIAHYYNQDGAAAIITPLVMLLILAVSNVYKDKLKAKNL